MGLWQCVPDLFHAQKKSWQQQSVRSEQSDCEILIAFPFTYLIPSLAPLQLTSSSFSTTSEESN